VKSVSTIVITLSNLRYYYLYVIPAVAVDIEYIFLSIFAHKLKVCKDYFLGLGSLVSSWNLQLPRYIANNFEENVSTT